MISRVVKNKNYSTISNVALNDSRLSLKAKGLYAYLMSKPDSWQISREGIRAQVKESKTAIDSALGELEAAGYLRRERTKKDERGKFKPEAVLYETPLPENRTTENQSTENRTQVSTDVVKTEEVNTDGKIVPSEQSAKPVEKTDKRDPEVTEMIQYFETAMDLKLPRPQYQRRAAKTLILRWGLPTALRAVDAVVACRDQQFAPRILSLEDLRDKWNKLTEFYKRTGADIKKRADALADIKKVTGVE